MSRETLAALAFYLFLAILIVVLVSNVAIIAQHSLASVANALAGAEVM